MERDFIYERAKVIFTEIWPVLNLNGLNVALSYSTINI